MFHELHAVVDQFIRDAIEADPPVRGQHLRVP
ncbi:MAG: hypothetical protein RL260_3783, partial [Pseudomonadota bacterium]